MSIITNFECSNISWRSATLTYNLSETVDDIYIYERFPILLNGTLIYTTTEHVFTNTDTSYLSGGERTFDELTPNTTYYFRLKTVKDNVATYSDWINVKTLSGASSIAVNDVDLDQNKITIDIGNVDKSNVVLKMHLYTKATYDGREILYTYIEKEIGLVDGIYTWVLNSDEKEQILTALKYGVNSLSSSMLVADSYIPNESIEDSNKLTQNYSYISINLNEDTYKPIINILSSSPDTKTTNILIEENYLIQGISSVLTSFNKDDITIGDGAELYSVKWLVTTPSGNTTTETVNYSSQTTFSNTLSPSQIYETGIYTITVVVTDTRGLESEEKTFSYISLSYHKPIIYAKPVRPLRSNGAVSLTYQASYSRLAIANQDKNSITNISYGYRNIIESTDYSTATLTGYTISNSQNGVDKELTLTDETWLEEGSVDTEKNYKFMFMLIDKVHASPTFYYVDLVDGVPIMRMLNNGQISIGMMPDTSDESTLLFVNSDIQAIDPYGEQRKVFETMGNMIQLSNEQPNNQMTNGLWLTEDGHMRIKTDEGYSEISPKTNATLVTLSNADETTVADKIESINTNIEEVSNDVTALQDNLSGLVFRKGGFQVTCDANSTVSHDITFDGFATNPFIYLSLFTQGASNQKYITATTQIESRSTTGATINISNNSSTAAIVQCGWMAVGQ